MSSRFKIRLRRQSIRGIDYRVVNMDDKKTFSKSNWAEGGRRSKGNHLAFPLKPDLPSVARHQAPRRAATYKLSIKALRGRTQQKTGGSPLACVSSPSGRKPCMSKTVRTAFII